MALFASLQKFFSNLFSRDPEEARRRAELKRIYAFLGEHHPPYYRPKLNLVLPAFAQSVYAFAVSLRPLSELARATVANSDVRISQRFFDYLIDCRLSPADRKIKEGLPYEQMSARVSASLDSDREIEKISMEFQGFLSDLEDLGGKEVNAEFFELDRFIELCRHDYERLLGLFDPAISLDSSSRRPEFNAADGESILPELEDLYYVTSGFAMSKELGLNLTRLLDRRTSGGIDEAKRKKIEKICAQLDRILAERLPSELLLALLRAAKGDPDYKPTTARGMRDLLDSYKGRLVQQFERDRDRIQRERHENAITSDIRLLFGEEEILEVAGYDEESDNYLRNESPTGFMWIIPLRILKTFIASVYEISLKESVKRILVEGYFENKNYQNNLANILYQCERSQARIAEFEELMMGNGRISLVAVRRYVEEMKRGKDIGPFLTRLVDAINLKAKEIVEDETGLFAMLGDTLGELVADYRSPSPELVTNIRTFAGGRNKEIMGQIVQGQGRIVLLVKIMRNFTLVRTGLAAAAASQEEPESGAPKPASPNPAVQGGGEEPSAPSTEEFDDSGLESLEEES
jgi:hypothetical protein